MGSAMGSKIALKILFSVVCMFGCASSASARIYHKHQAPYSSAPHIQAIGGPKPVQTYREISSPPMIAYQGYDGPAYLGHAGIPQSPLTPLKTEVPPPVDPNEAVSGSYGAMVHGFNAAGTGY
jgi:hypothetical protein